MKTCTKCGETKPLEAFHLYFCCKECRNKEDRARRESRGLKRRPNGTGRDPLKVARYREITYGKQKASKEHQQKQRLRLRQSMRQNIADLGDSYIKELISRAHNVQRALIPVELIEAKRAHLQLTRLIKEKTK